MDCGLDSSLKSLVDGFSALSDEYKHLAYQHEWLEQKLALRNREIEELRRQLPSNTNTTIIHAATEASHDSGFQPTRNLEGWLQQMQEYGVVTKDETLDNIRRAQIASYTIGSRLSNSSRLTRRTDRRTSIVSRSCSRPPSQPTIPEESMEQDFTEVRTPGVLGCPFAPTNAEEAPAGSNVAPIQFIHDPPTPHGSGRRSKRSSFVDPLRPDLTQGHPLSPAQTIDIEAGGGTACPIRFLDQHSPEEVAQYFEEHKHELPRSHEVCVKRFQTNAETIRELDAKYGNLVTMIQGLGQKHKDMLPETPNPDGAAESAEELEADRRVKNWAASISGTVPDEVIEDQDEVTEDRTSRFDRPMKEVRLGESPSRPWGVAIPSRILDREDISDVSSTPVAPVATSLPAPVERNEPQQAATEMVTGQAPPTRVSHDEEANTQRKCPIDHRALMARASPPVKAEHAPSLAPPTADAANLSGDKLDIIQSVQPKISNYGIAVVKSATSLGSSEFHNRGTMIMGYDDADARDLLTAASQQQQS